MADNVAHPDALKVEQRYVRLLSLRLVVVVPSDRNAER